jgi:site-specific DNA-methyltransferase (cytosine-N4-specific)
METVLLRWNGYRYFPYERELAKREVQSLLGASPEEENEGLRIPRNGFLLKTLDRLTYFRHIELTDGEKRIPDQTRLEVSSCRKYDKLDDEHCSSHQSTRYSAHGLHEYRGKFNPQIVRAIGNIIGLPIGAWVLDPFCGSGTTLLECAHVGWNAVGVDLNPLGVFISNAKVKAVHSSTEQLSDSLRKLGDSLSEVAKSLNYEVPWDEQQMELLAGPDWFDTLPNYEYLRRWFSSSVLSQFAAILQRIRTRVDPSLASVFQVILSDLVRENSLQEPADLRVRRRKAPAPNYPVIPMFIRAIEKRFANISAALQEVQLSPCYQQAFVGDSRSSFEWLSRQSSILEGQIFDCAITSPPYATALPYIDTQRLSLCLLGLILSSEVAQLDRQMIGTRELLESKRKALEVGMKQDDGHELPESVLELCRNMLNLAASPDNGFRRRNMPALIYTYCSHMAQVLKSVKRVLRPSGVFALVVGRNRTTLGGEAVLIDTPKLILDIGVYNGWKIRDVIELNTYARFDMHRRNSITTETLILFENS